jgi:hypothetical protein
MNSLERIIVGTGLLIVTGFIVRGFVPTPNSLVADHFEKLKRKEIEVAKQQLCSIAQSYIGGVIPLDSYSLKNPSFKRQGSLEYYEVSAAVQTPVKQGGTPYLEKYQEPLTGITIQAPVTIARQSPISVEGQNYPSFNGPVVYETREQTTTIAPRFKEKLVYPEASITEVTVEVWKSEDFYNQWAKREQEAGVANQEKWKVDKASNLAKYRTPVTAAQWDRTYASGPPPIRVPKRTEVSAAPLCINYSANWSHSVVGQFHRPTDSDGVFSVSP